MKRFNQILNTVMGVCFGVFIGTAIYVCHDYHVRPDLYALQSAPWYTSILVRGVFTLAVLAVGFIVKFIIRKKSEQ